MPGPTAASERTPLSKPHASNSVSLLRTPAQWIAKLRSQYSDSLLLTVMLTNHLLKGFVAGGGDGGFLGKPMEFLFAGEPYNLSASRMQLAITACLIPWSLKPLVGAISDVCPIYGYHKLPYLVVVTFLSVMGMLVLGLTALGMWYYSLPLVSACLCLFLAFLHVSTVDLLVDAKQSEEMKAKTSFGPEFMQFTWLGVSVGQVLGIILVGAVLDHFGPRWCFLFAAPMIALTLWPIITNQLQEKGDGICSMEPVKRNPALFGVGAAVVLAAVALGLAGALETPMDYLLLLVIGCTVIVLTATAMLLRPEIAGVAVYFVLLSTCTLKIDGALFYFFTDSPDAFAAGPHFSVWFYATGLGLATYSGYLVGMLTQEFFKQCSYHAILAFGCIGVCLVKLAMLPLLFRMSPTWLDPMYACTIYFLEGTLTAWCWIPKQVMQALLTPMRLEATSLAFLAGSFNLASLQGLVFGSALMTYLNVEPRGHEHEEAAFDGLPLAQTIAACAPLLSLPLVPFLVPGGGQTEILLVVHPESATWGSPISRLSTHRSENAQLAAV